MENKITIAMKLDMIEALAKGTENEAIIVEYCATERAKLDNKKAKAQDCNGHGENEARAL